jgi:hypothetical protein
MPLMTASLSTVKTSWTDQQCYRDDRKKFYYRLTGVSRVAVLSPVTAEYYAQLNF